MIAFIDIGLLQRKYVQFGVGSFHAVYLAITKQYVVFYIET